MGRDGELAALSTMLTDAVTVGEATMIVGEAEVGKSTPAAALSVHARSEGFRVLTGAGCRVQGEAGAGFAGRHDLLRGELTRSGAHLHRLLPELGITDRTGLRAALDALD